VANLPLGIIEPTEYRQFAVKLDKDDLVLIYTDALIEAMDVHQQPLGEQGLVDLARQVGPDDPQSMAGQLLGRVADYRGGAAAEDDQTLIVLHHNASDPPAITVSQAFKSLAKMIGLQKV
jgi:serine phosphatase RsbU (regulator of sigma subunit)